MAQKFVFANGEVSGSFKFGMTIKEVSHKDFVLREASVDDILAAEEEADSTKPLNFAAQLLLRQLVRVGTFEGPFTLNMLRRLKLADWRILREAQAELDELGESGASGEKTS